MAGTYSALPAVGTLSRVKALWERFGHLVHELGKFGVVGGVAYLIDVGVFNLFLTATGELWAKVISTAIAASAAFVGNRFWTWRDRERSGLRREYLLYFFFNAVGLAIALACLEISHRGLGHFWPGVFHTRLADNIAAQGVGLVLGTTFRFWSYKRFVFLAASTDTAARELAGESVTRP
jgi:putative flippase GtrA